MNENEELLSALKSRTDFEVIANFIRSGARVLDVGCGRSEERRVGKECRSGW